MKAPTPDGFSTGNVVRVSYRIAEHIAKNMKSFNEGEFIKDCLIIAAEEVCPNLIPAFQLLSLSRNTVTRRVEELGCDIERQLQDKIKSLTCFSLALDESTDRTNEAQLAVFLRGLLVNLVLLKSFYT